MYNGRPKYLLFDKHFVVLTLLTLGVVAAVSVVSQRTQTQQQASESVNLNTASEIDTPFNPDRTMGPRTSQGNFSNSMPKAYMGNLEVKLAGIGNQQISLTLDLSKAEVHLVRLFLPGVDSAPSEGINGQRTNQNVNKWETLQLGGNTPKPVTVQVENGILNSLGNTILTGGKYSEIRLYVSKATARFKSGKEVELVLPGNQEIIRVVKTFNVFSNRTTFLTLDVNLEDSIIQQGDTYFLKPVISKANADN